MSSLAGTGTLVRLALRRDRIRMPLWLLGLAALVVSTAWSIVELYDAPESLREFAVVAQANPAFTALNGAVQDLTTLGGRVVYEVYVYALIAAGLMSFLLVVRHTRGEEEAGRTELLRAGMVGTYAQPAAALTVVALLNVAVGAVTAIGLIAFELPTAGSLVFGAGMVAVGLVFAALGALTSQVAENGRTAGGLAGTALGAAYALRAAGDVGNETLTWLSPIGWAQPAHPYGDNVWWPLLLATGVAGVLVAMTFWLVDRRDVGAGLMPVRGGPAEASPTLSSPLGLAVRLQRWIAVAWAGGMAFLGAIYGSIGQDVEELLESTPELADAFLAQGGGTPTESYFAVVGTMIGVIAAGYVVQALSRLRTEEDDGRAELLLGAPVSRWAWAGSHVLVVAVGSVVVMVAAGLGTGAVHAVRSGDAAWVPELVVAMLVQVPAVWVIAGIALLLFGFVPRLSLLAWFVVAGAFVVGFFADIFRLPDWAVDVSPFSHVPQVPAADPTVTGVAALIGLAVLLGLAGLVGLRRRDITST